MGTHEIKENIVDSKKIIKENKNEIITKSSFEFLELIGRGGYGKVWKVYSKKYRKNFAMKVMSKLKIISLKSEWSIKAERDLLEVLNHPFIINMIFSFQDKDFLYIGMEYLCGGDLRNFYCKENNNINESVIKFFFSCIILSLEFIHSNSIIHRDLKPENLLMDEYGYLKLTDFGMAKIYKKDNYKETGGTPEYMAPEVLNGQSHTIAVDYYALGIIGYEFLMGKRPYRGKKRSQIKELVMSYQAKIDKKLLKGKWSNEIIDFINKLLQRKPANRLGLRGPTEVKEHSLFKGYDWKSLFSHKLISPYKPETKEGNFNKEYCNKKDIIGFETEAKYARIKASIKYKEIFVDFFYFNRLDNHEKTHRNNPIKNPHSIYIDNNKTTGIIWKENKDISEIMGKMNKTSINSYNRYNLFKEKNNECLLGYSLNENYNEENENSHIENLKNNKSNIGNFLNNSFILNKTNKANIIFNKEIDYKNNKKNSISSKSFVIYENDQIFDFP